jgi:hypothetical protein
MMSSKNNVTGMRGVYLAAAELARRGFIVSPTSRSAHGTDLLVTDQNCKRAYSVQVKTKTSPTGFGYWLLTKKSMKLVSKTHVYVFVQLPVEGGHTEFFCMPSKVVVKRMYRTRYGESMWYAFTYERAEQFNEWTVFGRPE